MSRGLSALQALVVEPELLEAADLEILGQHIRARSEPPHDFTSALGREIGDDRAFAAIAGMEIGGRLLAVRLDERRSPGARLVALGTLDLDHVRAEIGERLAGRRAGEHARKLEHPHASKGALAQKKACRPVCARPRISA